MAREKRRQNRRGYEGYKRTSEDVTCDCGVVVSERALAHHKLGVTHKHAKRIQALLNTPCITLEEIAERVGVTRQRIHQIAGQLQRDCGERRSVCTIRRRSQYVESRNSQRLLERPLKQLLERAEVLGLVTEPLYKKDGVVKLHTAMVNGALCAVFTARQWRSYCVIGHVRQDVEFALYLLPDDRWLVLPQSAIPKNHTYFAPTLKETRHGVGITATHRHDYRDYIDAWHLLAKQESIAA